VKVYFHKDFFREYTTDPAAERGRLEPAYNALKERYPIVAAAPCTDDDILLVHTRSHLESVRRNATVFELAVLAAGTAIAAAESAINGEMAFALSRPPGHHASPDHCWGFCYFNNVAIAVKRLLAAGRIASALVVDFDLHYGDGTVNSFQGDKRVSYWQGQSSKDYVQQLKTFLEQAECDLVAVSAGFDRHVRDWGGMLSTGDYGSIGSLLGTFSRNKCGGRLFAVLEGGYNSLSMAESIQSFLQGLDN
jgi:acetoin utilization deacetylase AcuC-like enzyme